MDTELVRIIDELNQDTRSGDRRRNVAAHDLVFSRIPGFIASTDRIPVIRAIRVLANLYDSRGLHGKAQECLAYLRQSGDFDQIRGQIETGSLPWRTRRSELKEELLALAEDNTSLLRSGDHEDAEKSTKKLLGCLEDDTSDETREIKIRANHLMGRILQTTGRPDDSEPFFATALEQCQLWIVESVDPSIVSYAQYQAGLAIAGLARSAIDQGHLSRCHRQLLIARIFLAKTQDRVADAYVEFLTGCYERQINQLSSACHTLAKAQEAFEKEKHERLYRRCTLELAQAYYNANQIQEAARTLSNFDHRPEQSSGDAGYQSNRRRWSVYRKLLEARLKLRANDAPAADRLAQSALEMLSDKWTDQVAVARAILAEAAVNQQKYVVAISHANAGLVARNGKPPLDVVDHAWLLIALAKAHLGRNEGSDVYSARRTIELCLTLPLENEIMKARRDEVINRIDAVGSLYIAHDEQNLDYHHWDTALRHFLLNRARERLQGAKPDEYAEKLNIGRATYYNWLKEFRQG